jgi:hypothetical protein
MRWLIAVGVLAACKSVHTTGEPDAAFFDANLIDAAIVGNPDFVVNTTYEGNQFLTNDFEAGGLQLAAINDSSWIAVFRDDCTNCDVFARRFDPSGSPIISAWNGSTSQFSINETKSTAGSIPAVAGVQTSSSPEGSNYAALVVWDFVATASSTQGVACRALDVQGAAASPQLLISTDTADVVTASPIYNGNFVVTWQTFTTANLVRSMVVTPDCAAVTTPVTVSEQAGNYGARRSHVASNGAVVMYTWIVDGDLHVRVGDANGALVGPDQLLIPKVALQEIDHARIAAWGSEFAVAIRWAATSGVNPGKIELYRVSRLGQILDGPHLITDRSGSDFASDKSFGVAASSGGYVLVAWHACPTGPGSCDVFGRFVKPSGEVLADKEQVLPTTTASEQTNPSVIAVGDVFVVAWTDASGTAPDQSGSAIRARVIEPPL